jgi:hypothetical protein
MEKGWEKIYVTNDPNIATIVREILEENEIESLAMNKGNWTLAFADTEIFVREPDVEKARSILTENKL